MEREETTVNKGMNKKMVRQPLPCCWLAAVIMIWFFLEGLTPLARTHKTPCATKKKRTARSTRVGVPTVQRGVKGSLGHEGGTP